MKRILVLLMICAFVTPVWAQTKITELTEDTAPTSDDLAVTVNDPGGTPGTRKATLSNFSKGLDHGNIGGLSDDDHTIYLLADGTRDLSGELNAGNNGIVDLGNVGIGTSNPVAMLSVGVGDPGTAGANDGYFKTDLEVDGTIFADGGVTGALTGNADTATALAANGANCSAGEAPLGVDASGAAENCTDYVDVSGDTMTGQLIINSAGNGLQVTDTTDAQGSTVATFEGNRATPGDGDNLVIQHLLSDSAGTQTEFAQFKIVADDVTDTTEDGSVVLSTMQNGTLTETLRIQADSLSMDDGTTDISETEFNRLDGLTNTIMTDDTAITGVDDTTLTVNSGTLRRAALTGDVTASAGSNTTTIATNAVATDEIDLSISPVWTGDHDFGGGGIEIENGTAVPGSCTAGQLFLDTDATSGQQLYACEGGSFVLQGDGSGSGSPGGSDTQIQYNNGGSFGGVSQLVWDGTNVGIGTISPTQELEIARITHGNKVQATDNDFIWGTTDDATFFNVDAGLTRIGVGDETPAAYFSVGESSQFQVGNTGNLSTTGTVDFGGAGSTELTNSATPTTNATGEIALDTTITDHQPLWQYFDGGENMTIIAIDTSQLPALDNEIVKYDAATDKFVLEADATGGGGGGGVSNYTLPVHGAKITGSFVTDGDATQGAQIDAGDGNWRLLFDATTDEGAVWQFVMPDNYSSAPTLDIHYSMASATTGTVEYEGAVMCVSDGDAADVGTASFSTVATGNATVPGTAGHPDKISITLNDDSCAVGDSVWIYLSTDADDGTNDTATGDREVFNVEFGYTSS